MIDVTDRDLLRACLLDGDAAREAYSAWRSYANPAALGGRHVRLMPVLYRNLQRLDIDDANLHWLRGLAKHTWLTASLRLKVVLKEIAKLNSANIPVVLLKGAALSARWPEAIETRLSGDVDFLVPAERAKESLHLLRQAGWTVPPPEFVSSIDFRKFHALGVCHSPNLWMDVHWRPSAGIGDPKLGREILARSCDVELDGTPVRVPDLAVHLFILLAHAFFSVAEARVDWAVEASFILARAKAEIDWSRFEQLVREYDLADWRRRALGFVQSVAEIEIPPSAFGTSTLRLPRPLEQREYAARKKTNPSPVEGLLCQFADAKRSKRLSLRDAVSANVLTQAGRLPMLRRVLSPATCLRLMQHGEARNLRFASIPSEGLDLRRDSPGDSFLGGWSYGESIGRWTDGQTAWAMFRVPDELASPVHVRLALRPAPSLGERSLKAKIWAGGRTYDWTFSTSCPQDEVRTLEGLLHSWLSRPVLPLLIAFDQPMDRENLGRKDPDGRSIGLLLSSVEFAAPINIPPFERELDLAEKGPVDRILWSGWGEAEPRGRWTTAHQAQLLLNLPQASRPARAVRVNLAGLFDDESGDPQCVEAYVDGTRVLTAKLSAMNPPPSFDVPLPHAAAPPAGLVDVRLEISRPMSPRRLGLSDDSRELGLMVRSLDLLK